MNENITENAIDLGRVFGFLRRKLLFIIASALIITFIGAALSFFAVKPVYLSKAEVVVNISDGTGGGLVNPEAFEKSKELTGALSEIVLSSEYINPVVEKIGQQIPGLTYEKILEMTEVEIVDGTQIMAISVKSTDPEISLALLNEIMDLLPEAVAKTADGAECHVVTRPYQVNGGSPVERSHVSVIVISFVLGLVGSVFVLTLFCIFSGKGDEQPGKNSEGKIGSAG